MNINRKIVLAISLVWMVAGCTALVPNSVLKDLHKKLDANNDGYVDYDEYLKSGSREDIEREAKEKGMTKDEYLKWEFNQADLNRDGKVTDQELINLFRR